mgnify:CR=1 FL=1
MPKLAKNMYRSVKTGEKKLNCYMVHIPKEIVKNTNITESSEIKVYSKDNKIIMITLYLYLTNNSKIFFESINKPSRIYSAQN